MESKIANKLDKNSNIYFTSELIKKLADESEELITMTYYNSVVELYDSFDPITKRAKFEESKKFINDTLTPQELEYLNIDPLSKFFTYLFTVIWSLLTAYGLCCLDIGLIVIKKNHGIDENKQGSTSFDIDYA